MKLFSALRDLFRLLGRLRSSRSSSFDEIYTLEEGMTRFRSLLDEYRNLYSAKELTERKALQLSGDVRQVIQILENRHQYWDHRRELFLQLGLGMVAFSIAAMAGLAAVFDQLMAHSPTFVVMWSAFTVVATLLLGGIQLIRVWNRQNNPDYPFTKAYDYWRWQYRYAEEIKLPFRYRYKTKEEFEEDIETYIKNLRAYAGRTLSLKPNDILEQDISQLFLLIENEKFKIKFVSELRNTLTKWLQITLYAGLASVVAFILVAVFGAYDNIKEYFGVRVLSEIGTTD